MSQAHCTSPAQAPSALRTTHVTLPWHHLRTQGARLSAWMSDLTYSCNVNDRHTPVFVGVAALSGEPRSSSVGLPRLCSLVQSALGAPMQPALGSLVQPAKLAVLLLVPEIMPLGVTIIVMHQMLASMMANHCVRRHLALEPRLPSIPRESDGQTSANDKLVISARSRVKLSRCNRAESGHI